MQAPVRILGATSTIFAGNSAIVVPSGSDKISNSGTITLTTAYQVATFYPIPTMIGGGYVVVYA